MTSRPDVRVREADLEDSNHCAAVVAIVDSYASEPVGGGEPLAPDVRARLTAGLRGQPNALVLLAFAGERPIGVAVCFLGFSTFRARALLNIHDLAVLPEHRGRGVGRALLAAAEARARRQGCCSLTLEVRDDNRRARALYDRFGFADAAYGGGSALTRFLKKSLEPSSREPGHAGR